MGKLLKLLFLLGLGGGGRRPLGARRRDGVVVWAGSGTVLTGQGEVRGRCWSVVLTLRGTVHVTVRPIL